MSKPISKPPNFIFGMNDKKYLFEKNQTKIELYKDFLWKINYSNRFYIVPPEEETAYKVYIGKGNNSNLIKGIIRRRSWWIVVDQPSQANFLFTQLKSNEYFLSQCKH
eukprot:GHVR01111324.1.p1 GENE.GHVR01111324.1~~GHVR01111324.1.p1  ORF type:complete len:108 (+),score=7.88 GHVR01111324.1:1955-2278(+)